MKPKIAIIGAGPGGLTAAMILAKRGFAVTVFEKTNQVGGRSGQIVKNGFNFDIGPTFLMMKFVLDEMFQEAGAKSEDYLEFTRLRSMYRLLWPDLNLEMSDDPKTMRATIAKYFPGDEEGFDRFLKEESKRFQAIFACLQKDYGSISDFFNPTFLKAIPYIPLGQNLFGYLGKYFKSDRLKLSFTFQAKYLGMSPWQCPAFFIILSYIEHSFGIYHTKGGLSEISRAMAKVAIKNGAEIRLNEGVEKIIIKDGKAKGLLLSDGSRFDADEVIVNADFTYAAKNLFPEGTLKKWSPKVLAQKKYSCSTLMFYWGVDGRWPAKELEHHNIFFAKDYRKNVANIFDGKNLGEDFSFYLRNADITDDSLAPKGKSAWYVLIPAPNNLSRVDWKKDVSKLRNIVIKRIAKQLKIDNLEELILSETIITPTDWESKMNIGNGATFNLAHNIPQMLYFRPHNRFEDVEHTWLVGGGTHPGSGLPTIYESGRIVSNLLCDDYKISYKKPTVKKNRL